LPEIPSPSRIFGEAVSGTPQGAAGNPLENQHVATLSRDAVIGESADG
jgi:hypothetical protein